MTSHPQRILVVDDDPDIRANLCDILSDLGYAVDVAEDGPRALAMIEQNVYDAALLDLRMPGMDGLALYRRIKAVQAGMVVVIVTAYTASETARAAIDAGAWEVLAKPVDVNKLMLLIEGALKCPMVILVEDDEELCDSLWDILQSHRYRTCIAHNVDEAKARLKQRNYQVAIIDMKLPKGDGRQVLQLVKESNPQARTVIVTGFSFELKSLLEQAIVNGADAVCYKPLDVPNLLKTLEGLAAAPQA